MATTEAPIPTDPSLKKEIRMPQKDQETPSSLLGSLPTATKLTQGRLLFATSPSISNNPTSTQTQPIQVTPTKPHPQNPTRLVTPSGEKPHLQQMTTPPSSTSATPVSSQSCPPKPKLSKEERDALRLEKERKRAEVRLRRGEEKARKEQEKAKREQERKERQEKKAKEEQEKRERKAKEEQEKKERKAREEQERKERKAKKDAEKRKREEERKKVELEKEQAKEEKLRREQLNKERFLGFFSVRPKEDTTKPVKHDYSIITPFSLKPNMTLAARPREPLSDTKEFNRSVQGQDANVSVENCVKELKRVALESGVAGRKKEAELEVVEIKPHDSKIKRRFKLLQFHENYRPAYFGTWRKDSQTITPRNPFRKDQDQLDYSVDSDEEWEEEDPGESISNSEGEDSGDEEEDEEDDGFFVPHGYLSDGEGEEMEHGVVPNGTMDDDDTKRKKMAAKAKAWEVEFARKCQPLKPVTVGCTWTPLTADGDNLSKDQSFLKQFAAVAFVELPLSLENKREARDTENVGGSSELTKMPVPEEAVPDLIRLIHKSSIGVNRIFKTFRMHWGAKKLQPPSAVHTTSHETASGAVQTSPKIPLPQSPQDCTNLENASGISKRQLEKKIHEIAVKESRPPTHRPLWYVHDSVLTKYNMSNNISPFISLSPLSKMNTDPVKLVTPVTEYCTSEKVVKRKTDGTKTLFEMLKRSPSTTNTTGSSEPKRIKLQLHVDKIPTKIKSENISQTQAVGQKHQSVTESHDNKAPVPIASTQSHDIKALPTQNGVSHDIKVPNPLQLFVAAQIPKLQTGGQQRQEKRELEQPVEQSTAKRLCLEDATNKTGNEGVGLGKDEKAGLLLATV